MDLRIKISIGKREFEADLIAPIDISIPLIFNGKQPNSYDVESAHSKAYEAGSFVGDVRKGGSCNFEQYTFVAHCNGTHTECVGHITHERISIHNTLKESFIPATLITVNPESSAYCSDKYTPAFGADDRIISRKILEEKLRSTSREFLSGLIIRTLPNTDEKLSVRYMEHQPPFFSINAMQYISELGVKHLLVDIPSVDRTFDEGKLSAHHIFWNVPQGTNHANEHEHSMNTITEMIYADNSIEDGNYLLNLQIASFVSDASPSRPVLYRVKN